MEEPLVSIIMGSDSDLNVMQQAADILESFGIPFEMTIVSAHRTPDRLYSYSKSAHERGIKVIIAGAEERLTFRAWPLQFRRYPLSACQ